MTEKRIIEKRIKQLQKELELVPDICNNYIDDGDIDSEYYQSRIEMEMEKERIQTEIDVLQEEIDNFSNLLQY